MRALLGVPPWVPVPPPRMPVGEPVLVAIGHDEGVALASTEGVRPEDSVTSAVPVAASAVGESDDEGMPLRLPPSAGLALGMCPVAVGASGVPVPPPPGAAEVGDATPDREAVADGDAVED